jgi:hypothetical protein
MTVVPITRTREKDAVMEGLTQVLPGINPGRGEAVQMAVDSIGVFLNDTLHKNLMKDENRRRGMAAYLKALLELHERATQQGVSLHQAAEHHSKKCRETLERAWVGILGNEVNRDREQSVRWCSQFFANLDTSAAELKGKVAFLDVTAEELASEKGLERLTEILSQLADYPDARNAYGYVVIRGTTGDARSLEKLGQRVHDACAVLITDAPEFTRVEDLRLAEKDLEQYAGTKPCHRHMVLLGGRGRARKGFKGQHAQEPDVFVESSGPWFGHYLHNIKQGQPWMPQVGYSRPISGFDDVELGLRMGGEKNIALYGKHRINPLILSAHDSSRVLVWGADTLSQADGTGVQIGVGVVEMLLLRYAEFVINKEGILNDIEEGKQRLRDKLMKFLEINSGAGKMFMAGSSVKVEVDYATKTYDVSFEVKFRVLGEKAFVRMKGSNTGPTEIVTERR